MEQGQSFVEWASKPTTEVVQQLSQEWDSYRNQMDEDVVQALEPLIATIVSRTTYIIESQKGVTETTKSAF